VEPGRDPRVGRRVQRLNPTVLASIALVALILLIAGVILLQRRGSEDDRLTGEEVATTGGNAEERCADRRTYDRIKREIFRQAAAVRGSDQAAFEGLAGHSSVRMEAAVLRDENRTTGTLTCNGTLTLDLAPGVAVAGGRRSLSADILYLVDSSGSVTVTNADEIVVPLATLARIAEPAEDPLTNTTNELVADPLAPVGGLPIDPLAPQPPRATSSPSFNCANARSRGEIAVCNDAGLAALDRQMAAQFASAVSEADPEQRAILIGTRNAFLRFRNQCPNSNCVADTYRGRMREIEAIMAGEWEPR
jgi:uncharacterized protein YecT (DUF1311 family)